MSDTERITAALRSLAPFPTEPIPPPEFPLDVLPPAMRRYVEEAARSFPAPPEMIALPMLALAGAVIGNRAHLHIKSTWRVWPSLWVVVVAPPGAGKTPMLDLAEWPTKALHRDAHKQWQKQKAEWDAEVARQKNLKPKERTDPGPPPPQKHYWTSDSTMEKMAEMLGAMPGVAFVGDEIAGWIERMDQYRKGGDRVGYMSIWSGSSLKVDRKSQGGSVYVERPVLGVVGNIQPRVAHKLSGEAEIGDGFIERILPLVPDLPPKRYNKEEVSEGCFADIAALWRTLDGIGRFLGEEESVPVRLSRESDLVFGEWSDENSALSYELGGLLGSFYTKLESDCARIALILHCLWHAADDPRKMCAAEHMRGAIAVTEFCRAHINRFLPLLNTGTEISARTVGTWPRLVKAARNWHQMVTSGDFSGIREFGNIVPSEMHFDPEWCPQWWFQNRLGNVGSAEIKEVLSIKLDTHNDLGGVTKREVMSGGRPRTEWRLENAFSVSVSSRIPEFPKRVENGSMTGHSFGNNGTFRELDIPDNSQEVDPWDT